MRLSSLLALFLLPVASASASIELSFSFQPSTTEDSYGLVGSTFTYTMITASDVYFENANGDPSLALASVQLTIENSSGGLDGTYDLQLAESFPVIVVFAGGGYLPIQAPSAFPTWTTEEGITITSGLGLLDSLGKTVLPGDIAVASDFDGLGVFTWPFTFEANDSGAVSYDASSATLSAAPYSAAVPEPATYAALGGLAALGLVAWRRRQQR
ncbi:MAG: PEP-CTERM sorting domain-containing protein [Verrucomicrobiota bacterium JB022]|nr:PEP-CTERM sorting domain-containing protein [Verrucomicrobiota bacterium JB022]